MNHHSLKTLPEFFEAILAGTKTFEARYDDRGFGVGDMLMLCEYDQQAGFYRQGCPCARDLHPERGKVRGKDWIRYNGHKIDK